MRLSVNFVLAASKQPGDTQDKDGGSPDLLSISWTCAAALQAGVGVQCVTMSERKLFIWRFVTDTALASSSRNFIKLKNPAKTLIYGCVQNLGF